MEHCRQIRAIGEGKTEKTYHYLPREFIAAKGELQRLLVVFSRRSSPKAFATAGAPWRLPGHHYAIVGLCLWAYQVSRMRKATIRSGPVGPHIESLVDLAGVQKEYALSSVLSPNNLLRNS